jgi:hypothetical protein
MKELREQFEEETGYTLGGASHETTVVFYAAWLESKLKETQLHFLKAEKRALENWIKLEDEREQLIRMAFLQGADYESGQGDYSKNKEEEIGEAIANYIKTIE